MMQKTLKDLVILIRGAGEMATGVALRLHRSNFRKIIMLETASPLAVRRRVSFCEAIYDNSATVEGIEAVRIAKPVEIQSAWDSGKIPLLVDPSGESIRHCKPDVLVDAILAKKNIGTKISDAPLVIAMGPGFTASDDCHIVIETNRGHNLGRLLTSGRAEANTGIPGDISGFTVERVLRSPAVGIFNAFRKIGDPVEKGDQIAEIGGFPVEAKISGILRGLIRPGSEVKPGMKIGDIDPRGDAGYCDTVSDKTRALGGALLEAILSTYNR